MEVGRGLLYDYIESLQCTEVIKQLELKHSNLFWNLHNCVLWLTASFVFVAERTVSNLFQINFRLPHLPISIISRVNIICFCSLQSARNDIKEIMKITLSQRNIAGISKLNLRITTPKGTTPVNYIANDHSIWIFYRIRRRSLHIRYRRGTNRLAPMLPSWKLARCHSKLYHLRPKTILDKSWKCIR